mgnify:CR=1 FL=1
MTDVMLDLETMSTRPNACIVAIGAVEFSETEGLGKTFYEVVDLESSMRRGLHVEGNTLNLPALKDRDSQFIDPLTRRLPGLKPPFRRPECYAPRCDPHGPGDHTQRTGTRLVTAGSPARCDRRRHTVGWCGAQVPPPVEHPTRPPCR